MTRRLISLSRMGSVPRVTWLPSGEMETLMSKHLSGSGEVIGACSFEGQHKNSVVKDHPAGKRGVSTFRGSSALVTHSSVLAWRVPWTEETGWLQSTGSQRVGHD